MACRIPELVIDCHDPKLMADFWCQVLGGFGGVRPSLNFSPTTEPKTAKP